MPLDTVRQHFARTTACLNRQRTSGVASEWQGSCGATSRRRPLPRLGQQPAMRADFQRIATTALSWLMDLVFETEPNAEAL